MSCIGLQDFPVSDHVTHPFAGTVDLGFDRTDRHIELLGDLFVGVLLNKPQFDHGAVARWQFGHDFVELGTLLVGDDAFFGIEGVGCRADFTQTLAVERNGGRAAFLAPCVID